MMFSLFSLEMCLFCLVLRRLFHVTWFGWLFLLVLLVSCCLSVSLWFYVDLLLTSQVFQVLYLCLTLQSQGLTSLIRGFTGIPSLSKKTS